MERRKQYKVDKCEVCGGKGWLLVTVYGSDRVPDGTEEIQRCDNCMKYQTDEEAQQAEQEG